MEKIILIDDNKYNQRDNYEASYVDNGEYAECLYHVEKLNGESDYSFLDNAACVLLHDSLDDYVDGKFISGSRIARECVMDIINANKIPFVLFSDGHSIVGDWNPTRPKIIQNIKKSEFYRNLKAFLDLYKEKEELDFRIIAFGINYKKREITHLLQRIIINLSEYSDKDVLTISMVDESLYQYFFEKVNYLSSINYPKIKEWIFAGKFKVGQFRAYINSLAVKAINYSGKVPKSNILLLGNSRTKGIFSGINNVTFKNLTEFPLGEKGERELFEQILSNISDSVDGIIIDVDSVNNPSFCLSYALAIRLSFFDIKKAAFAPIILMSNMASEVFKSDVYSSLLQTKGLSFETQSYTPYAIELIEPLLTKDFHRFFLDLIKVKPNSLEGRHSIANQWGADVLSRVLTGSETNNELIKKARLSLYFRYVRALSLTTSEIDNIIKGIELPLSSISLEKIDAKGKKVMLIDDEADKGWGDVLRNMLPGSEFYIINEQVPDYESLSEKSRKEIESGKYDLFFLDLRLNGVAEEGALDPNDFSGMKILKTIKHKQNRGNQVIMLTASNKAWNMKALLDAGADGYYIKESPEYAVQQATSDNNAKSLVSEIKNCFNRSYLRTIYRGIDVIVSNVTNSSASTSLRDRIRNQLNIAFVLINKATSKQEYAFAYISLEQILELISDEFIGLNRYKRYYIKENGEECINWIIKDSTCKDSKKPQEEDFPQWKMIYSIYHQLLNGKDTNFGVELQNLIEKRNAFIHNDKELLYKKILVNNRWVSLHQDIYNQNGFVRLFNAIKKLTSHF